MRAVQCDGCGGAVVLAPGQQVPTCVFCGSEALVPADPSLGLEPPTHALPFAVDQQTADVAFRDFASSSIWYPGAIRNAQLELRQLMLPAWMWSAVIETHWTGLQRAVKTQSGKRPRTGQRVARYDQVLVPASSGLKQEEMNGISPFDESHSQAWDAEQSGILYELIQVTREASRARAGEEISRREAEAIQAAEGLLSCHTAGILSEVEGRSMLVPVWIGVYRHKDVPYRIVVNGQTGLLHGKAPTAWWKVILAILTMLVVLAFAANLLLVWLG
jgi:hypothetical protein